MTMPGSRQVNQFGWLISNFTERVPGVAHAVVVSVDGLMLAASSRLPGERAEQLSAVASGVVGLTQGAARCLEGGGVLRTVVEMERGVLLLMSVRDGSCLAVLASPDSSVGQVAYEMTVLVDQVGQILTPELRAELQVLKRSATRQPA
ncbi:MAG TPA: roadblock/LC7 domain-containing protein [Pseudonocardiaceae bacterium]